MKVTTRTDTVGCVYLGIQLDAHSTVYIPASEAVHLAAAIRERLAEIYRVHV